MVAVPLTVLMGLTVSDVKYVGSLDATLMVIELICAASSGLLGGAGAIPVKLMVPETSEVPVCAPGLVTTGGSLTDVTVSEIGSTVVLLLGATFEPESTTVTEIVAAPGKAGVKLNVAVPAAALKLLTFSVCVKFPSCESVMLGLPVVTDAVTEVMVCVARSSVAVAALTKMLLRLTVTSWSSGTVRALTGLMVGGSLTGVTLMVMVTTAESRSPSLATKVKVSGPSGAVLLLESGLGVYVKGSVPVHGAVEGSVVGTLLINWTEPVPFVVASAVAVLL